MTPNPRPIAEATVRFSTEEYVEREPPAALREVSGHTIVKLAIAPPPDGETSSAIAFAAGSVDLSHFNHSVRRRYGCTPTARAAVRPERNGEAS